MDVTGNETGNETVDAKRDADSTGTCNSVSSVRVVHSEYRFDMSPLVFK